MMGAEGLTQATRIAILNANYIARRLAPHYPVVYVGRNGMVAHEYILDLRAIKERTGIPSRTWPSASSISVSTPLRCRGPSRDPDDRAYREQIQGREARPLLRCDDQHPGGSSLSRQWQADRRTIR